MRQAGRSLPEYRAVREGVGMLEACRRPDLVAEITLQPVRRHGVDAAILFTDIVVPLAAVGVDLDIVAGVGPGRRRGRSAPAPTSSSCATWTPDDVPYVAEAVRPAGRRAGRHPADRLRRRPVHPRVLPRGGRAVANHEHTKALMYGDPELWHACGPARRRSRRVPAGAGRGRRLAPCSCSTRGSARCRGRLPASVLPHSAAVLAAVADLGVPRIHFGVGTGELLGAMGEAGADVVGVDWRVPLDDAPARLGAGTPCRATSTRRCCSRRGSGRARGCAPILAEGRAAPGHVFNLGHGVLPETDPDVLTRVVELVHEASAR